MSKQSETQNNGRRHHAVTQQDIARVCGVSQKAVSLGLQGSSKVSAATRRRILKAADKLGYDAGANDAARQMQARIYGKHHRTDTVGILLPENFGQHSYYFSMLQGVLWVLSGLQISVNASYLNSPFTLEQVPKSARRGDLDGMLVVVPEASANTEHILQTLRATRGFASRPIVLMMAPHPECPYVTCDYRDGAYQAAKHLLELGHRHLLLQTLSTSSVRQKERREGVEQAYRELGIAPKSCIHTCPIADQWLHPAAYRQEESAAYQKADTRTQQRLWQTLQKKPQITAILALSDTSAIRTFRLLQAKGKRVPQDYSVVGFDDIDPLLEAQGQNILTTVQIPLGRIGQHAAGLLMQLITNTAGQGASAVLETKLVIRQTTGQVATRPSEN